MERFFEQPWKLQRSVFGFVVVAAISVDKYDADDVWVYKHCFKFLLQAYKPRSLPIKWYKQTGDDDIRSS
jgi:hypothetical protein